MGDIIVKMAFSHKIIEYVFVEAEKEVSTKQINFKIRNKILSEFTILLSQSVMRELVLEINAQESNIFYYIFNVYLYILKVKKIEVCGFLS